MIRTKPIETLQEGDLVVSRNEKTGKIEFKKVLKTTIKTAPLVLTIKLSDARTGNVVESLTATREHPLYVQGKGFVPAGGLAVGNAIVTRAGPALIVKSITWNRRREGYPVFNCVIEDDHTYFVGTHNGGVWVHNYEKRGPKLWPDGPHNETIQRRIDELTQQGMTHEAGGSKTEEWIDTPGGYKPRRRVDITMQRPDGTLYREQVGRTMADGSPVPREVKALDDIENALGERPGFTPYYR